MKNVESLLIDIQTMLKMMRFVPSFSEIFLSNHLLSEEDILHCQRYINSADIISKEHIWGFCSVVEHIIEINKLIKKWRKNTIDYAHVELSMEFKEEKSFSYDIIGRIIKTKPKNIKFKKLMKEIKDNKFYYNGMSIITSRAINSNEISRLCFFY